MLVLQHTFNPDKIVAVAADKISLLQLPVFQPVYAVVAGYPQLLLRVLIQ